MPELITPAPVVEMTAEQTAQLEALIDERANLRFRDMVEREQRKNQILEFTRAVTGKGLPVQGEDLSAFLSSLTPDQLEKAEALFSKIADTGVIDYEEHGHSKTVQASQPLPDGIKRSLRAWIDAGQDMAEFFRMNAVELGAMSDYDLKEFEQEK